MPAVNADEIGPAEEEDVKILQMTWTPFSEDEEEGDDSSK